MGGQSRPSETKLGNVHIWSMDSHLRLCFARYLTYVQWQRAETLGALVNGVFLVALCLSIFLEAIQRFVEPQTVSNPFLVFIVGCFGLASNFLGIFLFHEHGHSHDGGRGHAHGGVDKLATAEEGYSHSVGGEHTQAVADESGNIAAVLPQSTVAGWPKSRGGAAREGSQDRLSRGSKDFPPSDEDDSTVKASTSPLSMRKSHGGSSRHRRSQTSGGSWHRYSSMPERFRQGFVAPIRPENMESREEDNASSGEEAVDEDEHVPTEETPLLGHAKNNGFTEHADKNGNPHAHKADDGHDSRHHNHNHNQAIEAGSGRHSHGDLNMRGVFLHVIGDALGNVGVIVSALVIGLSHNKWRFYADPAISLVITLIILGSAIPLCKAASRILLQAVPVGMSVEAIKKHIEHLPGILSCHDLHVWQLSDAKVVASLHVQVEFDFKGEGSKRYMLLARQIRRCLHEYGIHSYTIQPEFCLNSEHQHTSTQHSDTEDAGSPKSKAVSKGGSKAGSMRSEVCLFDERGQCCRPGTVEADTQNEENRSH